MSTNDTVLLLASGAARARPALRDFTRVLTEVCADLARQLQADAEGATKAIAIEVVGAASEDDALTAGRAVARSTLVKCAIVGEDPNWDGSFPQWAPPAPSSSRSGSAWRSTGSGTCRNGCAGDYRSKVDLRPRDVTITVHLSAGPHAATIRTTDLTAAYVHENATFEMTSTSTTWAPAAGPAMTGQPATPLSATGHRPGPARATHRRCGGPGQGGHADRGPALAGPLPRPDRRDQGRRPRHDRRGPAGRLRPGRRVPALRRAAPGGRARRRSGRSPRTWNASASPARSPLGCG